jgi:hypothetical protein
MREHDPFQLQSLASTSNRHGVMVTYIFGDAIIEDGNSTKSDAAIAQRRN